MRSLYDKKVFQLKNKKWVVFVLIFFLIILGISKLIEATTKSIKNIKDIKKEVLDSNNHTRNNDENELNLTGTESKEETSLSVDENAEIVIKIVVNSNYFDCDILIDGKTSKAITRF